MPLRVTYLTLSPLFLLVKASYAQMGIVSMGPGSVMAIMIVETCLMNKTVVIHRQKQVSLRTSKSSLAAGYLRATQIHPLPKFYCI